MTRNWAAFTSVALVAVLLAAIGVVGATQGLFGFSRGDEDALNVVQLERSPGDGLDAAPAEPSGSDAAAASLPSRAAAAREDPPTASAVEAGSGAGDAGTMTSAAPLPARFEDDDERYDDEYEDEFDDEGHEDDDEERRSEALVAATPGVQTFQVGEAGFVTLELQGAQLSVVEVAPAAGWTVREVEEEDGGREVQVELRAGEREVTFSAHYEDGQIRARVGVEYEDD